MLHILRGNRASFESEPCVDESAPLPPHSLSSDGIFATTVRIPETVSKFSMTRRLVWGAIAFTSLGFLSLLLGSLLCLFGAVGFDGPAGCTTITDREFYVLGLYVQDVLLPPFVFLGIIMTGLVVRACHAWHFAAVYSVHFYARGNWKFLVPAVSRIVLQFDNVQLLLTYTGHLIVVIPLLLMMDILTLLPGIFSPRLAVFFRCTLVMWIVALVSIYIWTIHANALCEGHGEGLAIPVNTSTNRTVQSLIIDRARATAELLFILWGLEIIFRKVVSSKAVFRPAIRYIHPHSFIVRGGKPSKSNDQDEAIREGGRAEICAEGDDSRHENHTSSMAELPPLAISSQNQTSSSAVQSMTSKQNIGHETSYEQVN
jgi:hypothetical protein